MLKEIADLSGLKIGSLPFKYLGIPMASRKLSVLECSILVERVVDRIRALGARKLSYAGRLQGDIHAHSPALVSWDSVCHSKQQGGLGITDIILWNRAAMGKYIWWIMQKKDHLWVK
ncbi:uncharacterized protein LOC141601326 [Silene latifolia]|uniref:uncharacterized protein LOC141601326 n=1 Tax=Silene latifolia TaxID=37657 RepID=UPI003D76D819